MGASGAEPVERERIDRVPIPGWYRSDLVQIFFFPSTSKLIVGGLQQEASLEVSGGFFSPEIMEINNHR